MTHLLLNWLTTLVDLEFLFEKLQKSNILIQWCRHCFVLFLLYTIRSDGPKQVRKCPIRRAKAEFLALSLVESKSWQVLSTGRTKENTMEALA
jgi:hypothetical protein